MRHISDISPAYIRYISGIDQRYLRLYLKLIPGISQWYRPIPDISQAHLRPLSDILSKNDIKQPISGYISNLSQVFFRHSSDKYLDIISKISGRSHVTNILLPKFYPILM